MLKQILALIAVVTVLTGCSSIEFDELASTGAAAGAATIASAAGLPPVVVLTTGVSAGVATSAVTEQSADPVELQDYRGEDGELSFVEAAAFAWANFSQHLIGIAVVIGLFLLMSTYIGARLKRPEEKSKEIQLDMLLTKLLKD